MSRTVSHSLLERLAALSANDSLNSTENKSDLRLTLTSRDHDSRRLPVLDKNPHLSRLKRSATARAASAVLQDLRSQMRVAEDMMAKLGYQMRELQKLRAPKVNETSKKVLKLPLRKTLEAVSTTRAKVLKFRSRS